MTGADVVACVRLSATRLRAAICARRYQDATGPCAPIHLCSCKECPEGAEVAAAIGARPSRRTPHTNMKNWARRKGASARAVQGLWPYPRSEAP